MAAALLEFVENIIQGHICWYPVPGLFFRERERETEDKDFGKTNIPRHSSDGNRANWSLCLSSYSEKTFNLCNKKEKMI